MVSMRVRDRESIQESVRRFRKLVERSGLKREMRRRQYYEKPSEIKRRAHLRAQRRAAHAKRISTHKIGIASFARVIGIMGAFDLMPLEPIRAA